MDTWEKFDVIFDIGRQVCAAYTGFSKTEVLYCQQKRNWQSLYQFLQASNIYEALISFSLHPINDVVGYFQMFVGCMVQFPNERCNDRLSNLLDIVDTQVEFDGAILNARMMRALLAIAAKYDCRRPQTFFCLFLNAKRILAHVLKKYPDYFKLNVLKSNRKHRALRFKPDEIQEFW